MSSEGRLRGFLSRQWLFLVVAASLAALAFCPSLVAQSFRTDGGTDEKLPWFQLKPGEFPPEQSAHYIAGELIGLDHISRTGTLRQDRTDMIPRSHWDEALPFAMLSFGSIGYHGAPAELRDIPIGTHLHGQFHFEDKAGKDGKGAFTKAIRLEDDFTFFARHHRVWRVDAIEVEKGILTATSVGADGQQADPKPAKFVISPATRVWKGHGIGALGDVTPGQNILLNLTVCTLKGPGRCTDLWLDGESRETAAAQQREIHRQFEHEHGLPAWVETVDNQESIITVALFDGFDPKLLDDFTANESMNSAVAVESLRTYDQNSDRMGGTVLAITKGTPAPGDSGVRLKFKTNTLIEGDRPKRILRVWSGKWKVDDIPKEERAYP
jgi:hypothetical protein